MTDSLTEILRLEVIRQLEQRWDGMEKRVHERMRVMEMQLMHMERQMWKRSHTYPSRGPPRTPGASTETSSVSSRSSITTPLASPGVSEPWDAPTTPDSFSASWLYSIIEDTEVPLPGTYYALTPGAGAFEQALLVTSPTQPVAPARPAPSSDESRAWEPLPAPVLLSEHLGWQDQLRALLGSDQPELSAQLQRILKHGSPEHRRELLGHIQALILPLAQDRLGHFVVIRALRIEPTLAKHLRGMCATLLRSPYGAEVVQYMLDQDTGLHHGALADLFASNLRSLLLVPEALPVWRQVFSTAWTDADLRQRIHDEVSAALRGHWVATANTESGHAVCQSLVEHHWLSDQDDGVQDMLAHLLELACHQWGVWVVQHMLEHGSRALREAIAQRLLQAASTVTLSSYGGKAIQSALHWCGAAFHRQYAECLCSATARPTARSGGTTRPLLIELAAAQHGLPIITELLTTAHPARRTLMIRLVDRHTTYLKSNRSGARVCLLCDRARAIEAP